jgi:hypothetical protein
MKQLVIFLSIAEHLQSQDPKINIYAQDPAFSAVDEQFLQSLGIKILHTPSTTNLGGAARYINGSTLVYCPFLTLEAYELLFATTVNTFISDDFNALRIKWPKYSAERKEVEQLLKQYVQQAKRRPLIEDNEFWNVEIKPFPMAMYSRTHRGSVRHYL